MLTREDAINVINEHATERGTFVFKYSFPLSSIPKGLEIEKGFFDSILDIEKDILSHGVQNIIYGHLLKSKIVYKSWSRIEFINIEHRVSLLEIIDNLNHYQNEYEKMEEEEDNDINNIVNIYNKIRDCEYLLIDEAKILLDIRRDIDLLLANLEERISNKKEWIGD